jgi:hypothetical protein
MKRDIIISLLSSTTMAVMLVYFIIVPNTNRIVNLTKEIDRLKPYEENFKILADSIVDCHRHCFTIGQ